MKNILFLFLLLALLLASTPANASTCLCVGAGNSRYCGSGGMGGSFLRVDSVSANYLQYYITTTALRSQLEASGKAYDSKTGWFCWNGTLQ